MNINVLSQITPTRSFNLAYIILDSLFLITLCLLLFFQKKKVTLLFSLFGGLLYLLVDFGIFYLLLKSRTIYIIKDGEMVLQNKIMTLIILTWLSFSYGITNFCYIWLALKKDKNFIQYMFLIFGWWLMVPTLSKMGGEATIVTMRTTNEYHWVMALILVVGYGGFIIYELFNKNNKSKILWLNLIGISIQFAWEVALLINSIRPWNEMSVKTLIINSLMETNLGMPYIYLIYLGISKHFNEDLTKKSKSLGCS